MFLNDMSLLVDMVFGVLSLCSQEEQETGMCRVPQYIFQFQNGILETLK